MRRNLVVVRAGNGSLHPEWLAGPGERNWDLIVSYFGNSPDLYREDGVRRIDGAGPKWPALHDLFVKDPSLLDGYDYIWLPDDDLRTDKASINRLFDLVATHGLEVAQPALTWDSYFGHLTTLRNRGLSVRFTNYVEVMAPCLSKRVLMQALPSLNANLSGWGLDFIWSRWVENPRSGVGIIDAVTVCHTRPVGGPNYQKLREGGISPWDELRTFCRAHDIDEAPVIRTHMAIRQDGRPVGAGGDGRWLMLRTVWGTLGALRQTPERKRMARRMAGMVYKALRGIPDRVAEKPIVNRLWGSRPTARS